MAIKNNLTKCKYEIWSLKNWPKFIVHLNNSFASVTVKMASGLNDVLISSTPFQHSSQQPEGFVYSHVYLRRSFGAGYRVHTGCSLAAISGAHWKTRYHFLRSLDATTCGYAFSTVSAVCSHKIVQFRCFQTRRCVLSDFDGLVIRPLGRFMIKRPEHYR